MSEASPAALSNYTVIVATVVKKHRLKPAEDGKINYVSEKHALVAFKKSNCQRRDIIQLNNDEKRPTTWYASRFALDLFKGTPQEQEATFSTLNNISDSVDGDIAASIRLQTMLKVYLEENEVKLDGERTFDEGALFRHLGIDNIVFTHRDDSHADFYFYENRLRSLMIANPSCFRIAIEVICFKIGLSYEWLQHGRLKGGSQPQHRSQLKNSYDGLGFNLTTFRRRERITVNRTSKKDRKEKVVLPAPAMAGEILKDKKLVPPPDQAITQIVVGQQPEAKLTPPQQKKVRTRAAAEPTVAESDQEPSSFATEVIDLKISDENYMDEEKRLMVRGYRSMFFKKQGIMRFYPKGHFVGDA